MNKMQIAHEYTLEMLKETLPTGSLYGDDANRVAMSMVELAWTLADAMQAEAEERENKERPDVLKEEWHPDWNQAPAWANWWAMDSNGDSYWHSCVDEPFVDEFIFEIANPQGHTFDAPSFNYQGHWRNSLQKRPQ